MNSRPLGPEPSALPGCATPRLNDSKLKDFLSNVQSFEREISEKPKPSLDCRDFLFLSEISMKLTFSSKMG